MLRAIYICDDQSLRSDWLINFHPLKEHRKILMWYYDFDAFIPLPKINNDEPKWKSRLKDTLERSLISLRSVTSRIQINEAEAFLAFKSS